MKKGTREIIDALSSGPVRQYLNDHAHEDLRKIILANKEIFGIPPAQIFDQIAVRRKAKEKLPLYYATPGIVYPPAENFEQSSSEKTALFKARIAKQYLGEELRRGADLTGGFGVDTYFLSRVFADFQYIEPDDSLLEIAKHNHQLLGATNIEFHHAPAEDFITTTSEAFDFIFIDPSRRTQTRKKVYSLEDAQPDILKLIPHIFRRTNWLMIKASPLFDIQAGISKIPSVRTVFVVSVSNECKELLFLCEHGFNGTPVVEAVNIPASDEIETFSFTFPEERSQSVDFGGPENFLYEPNASILKAGAFKTIATRYPLKKLHINTHLYTSARFIERFPGKTFRVEALIRPVHGEIKKFFADGKANVTTRNYPLSPDALKKKTGLKDGGDKYLIAFSGQDKKYLAVAHRI